MAALSLASFPGGRKRRERTVLLQRLEGSLGLKKKRKRECATFRFAQGEEKKEVSPVVFLDPFQRGEGGGETLLRKEVRPSSPLPFLSLEEKGKRDRRASSPSLHYLFEREEKRGEKRRG